MKEYLQVLFLVFILISCGQSEGDGHVRETILIDFEYLQNSKTKIENNDPSIIPAYKQLIRNAEEALNKGPYSVTHKEKVAPSRDKHDYASYSRYWWPDPDQSDGLPYIRRDGETNPASQSLKESDRQRIGALGFNVETLGLAYFFTGKEKYAKKAAQLLRVWFLDEATLMNPNVNHAQCRPGHNTGTKSGILDGRLMTRALDGSLLISNSQALSDSEYQGLEVWASEYFEWLTTNKMALEEAASKNNHGSYYDAQAIYFALYSKNEKAAKEIAENFIKNRLNDQIEVDGSMPEETKRTRPLFYSIYNLHALFLVAHLSEKVDIDIYNQGSSDSRLRVALDHLAPYVDSDKSWPQATLKEADRMELFTILHMAEYAYPDGSYLKLLDKLPIERRKTHRANLAIPLMR